MHTIIWMNENLQRVWRKVTLEHTIQLSLQKFSSLTSLNPSQTSWIEDRPNRKTP